MRRGTRLQTDEAGRQASEIVENLRPSQLDLRYRATGSTALDDLEEFMVAELPPYLVPREHTRLDPPPPDGDDD